MSQEIKTKEDLVLIKEKKTNLLLKKTRPIYIPRSKKRKEEQAEKTNTENEVNTAIQDLSDTGKQTTSVSIKKSIQGLRNELSDKGQSTAVNKNREFQKRRASIIVEDKEMTQAFENDSNNKFASKKYKVDYQQKMKSAYLTKRKKEFKLNEQIRNKSPKEAVLSIKRLKSICKQIFDSGKWIYNFGLGLILMIIMTLFIGVFSSLADHHITNKGMLPISEAVLVYNDLIEEYAQKYDIEEYIPLIRAIMMVESGGVGSDPMDASEYEYNEEYPAEILDSEVSIDVGIHYLADCLSLANVTSPKDKENLNLAIQGYDYHKEYIQWALENFGGYSKANTKVYADYMKAQLDLFIYGDVDYVEHVLQYIGFDFGTIRSDPDFSNDAAWGYNNPYSRAGLYGQCTWFAWGRFYEIYGFDPGFTGNGWNCVDQLVKAHPDKFMKSNIPEVGSIFSCIGRNHVGIVIGWDGTTVTIQEGNLDGITNTFKDAQKDWHTVSYEFEIFEKKCKGVIFANSI